MADLSGDRCIGRPRHDLALPGADLSAVAFRNGFSDQSHMGRCFRHYVGLTPATARALPGHTTDDAVFPAKEAE